MSANKMTGKSKPKELRVVFDTNILYTGSEADFVKRQVRDLIEAHKQHHDLVITWYVPEVVRHERQYQMLSKALKLLPSIQKLERLLGHNLNITESILEKRVEETVWAQLEELGLTIIKLDPDKVDWPRLMIDACYRYPPFTNEGEEKGFRDALIIESFLQLVANSPKAATTCRVVLVSEDALLGQAVRPRTKASNVGILESLEDLQSLINTLVSEVTEEFVDAHIQRATNYFFEEDDDNCLYKKENVRDQILQRFDEQLKKIPDGASSRENGTWYISPPKFVKKERQRVFWANRITVKAESFDERLIIGSQYPHQATGISLGKLGVETQPYITGPILVEGSTIVPQTNISEESVISASLSRSPISWRTPYARTKVADGKSTFVVTWSVILTTKGNFKSPHIESIKHVETAWD